jgi:two-component system, LuxR family, sensor kinase FixL
LDAERPWQFTELLGWPRAVRVRLFLAALLILVYLLLEWFSFLQDFRGLPVSPWNPGLGVLFAFMLARRLAYGFVLFAAIVASELFLLEMRAPWPTVVVIAGVASAIYTMAAATIRSMVRDGLEFDRVKDVATLAAVGAVASLISAALLSATFISGLVLQRSIMLQMFIGDLVGIMVMTPLALRLLRMNYENLFRRRNLGKYAEAPLHVVAIGIALAIISQTGLDEAYILFIPIVITAVRYGFDGACVAIAAIQFGLGIMLHAMGAGADAFFEFQTAMLALTTAGLFVGAEVNARIRADNLARAAEAELQKAKEANIQAERFSIVEGMASALAHEINQPMTAIRALVRSSQVLLESEEPNIARASTNLGNAVVQVDHAAAVLRRMRDFLKRRQLDLKRVSTHDLLSRAPMLSRSQIPPDIAIGAELGEEHYIDVDPVQINQVFLNLIHNSAQAIKTDPAIRGRIEIGALHKKAPERIEFFVRDNGPGVPAKRAKSLFEPLRTTKGDGLGLGLAICVTIVEAHGGQIRLESGKPGSTEFRFWVPLKRGMG